MPSTTNYIAERAFYDAPSSAVLVCNATTPPELRYFIFNYSNSIYVPSESVNAYKTGYWVWDYGRNIKSISLPDEILLNNSNLKLKLGSSSTLRSTNIVSPQYLLSWSSSNNKIATVFNGEITAISPGECDITVRYNSLSATCHVIVESNITDLQISEQSLNLDVNEKTTLRVTTTPSSIPGLEINWESSNPDVAIVENGNITALKAGTATITASVNNDGKLLIASTDITVTQKTYTLYLRIPEGAYAIKDLTTPFTFSVIPDEGWKISSASFDDNEITLKPEEISTFTTPDEIIDHTFSVVLIKNTITSNQDVIANKVKLSVKSDGITILGYQKDDAVKIFDMKGVCCYEGHTDFIPFELNGCFILTVGNNTFKFMK